MSKKLFTKFYSDPTQDPSFEATQRHWYRRLKREGFEDQEDHTYADRPLKRWSGISSIYVDAVQPGPKIVSSFPVSSYREQDEFKNHKEFNELCLRLSQHGNHRLTPGKIAKVWADYCDGKTIRESEKKYKVSDTTIFRVIRRVTEWMNLMDTRPENAEPEANAVIVLRPFNPTHSRMSDSSFIYSSWHNSLWWDEKRDEALYADFYSAVKKSIRALVSRPDVKVQIATDKKDPDFIAGYSVMVGTHLEFVYVKVDYRGKGIAKLLTKGMKTWAEPMTKVGRKIVEKWKKNENTH